MTIHNAKGLEFDVVAIPDLSRGLLPAARTPLLTLGREQEPPRVGMQLRRLGARGVNLYDYASSARRPRSAKPRRSCASSTSARPGRASGCS